MKIHFVLVTVATFGLGFVSATTSPNDEAFLEIGRRTPHEYEGVKRTPSEWAEVNIGKRENGENEKGKRQEDLELYWRFQDRESEDEQEEHANKRDTGEIVSKVKRQQDGRTYWEFHKHEDKEEHANKRDIGKNNEVKR
ncbi:Hypothetical predicted protein [Lecanosticta acicola]|uniref:Secreted RxLR effector peptide protein n=1 Tax=Lecanosticta acicola TaxID=111012 RepID=A0AAI8YT43_9PEZI|nr:Hypothetical predicted protein [Lecanosticta acicola]